MFRCGAVCAVMVAFGVTVSAQTDSQGSPGDIVLKKAPPDGCDPDLKLPGGKVAYKVAPQYPPLARQARIQGTVYIDVLIAQDGMVKDMTVVSGHPMLAPAAKEAVGRWRYEPLMNCGVPVEGTITVQVDFILAEPPKPQLSSPDANNFKRIRVSEGVAEGLRPKKKVPNYQPDPRYSDFQQIVLLTAIIDREGTPRHLKAISGPPALHAAAINLVRQWRYQPYHLNGEAIEIETTIRVKFDFRPN